MYSNYAREQFTVPTLTALFHRRSYYFSLFLLCTYTPLYQSSSVTFSSHKMNSSGINNTNSSQHPPPIIVPPQHALLPAGQKLLSILTQKFTLPPYVESKINQELNEIAEEFLIKIQSAVADLLFEADLGNGNEVLEHKRRRQHQQKHKYIKTIVDKKDWYKIEQQYEKAIRFFPDTLHEMRYGCYPIQLMVKHLPTTHVYNLQSISLIPLVARLGIESQQFDAYDRGGLLLENVDDEGGPIQCTSALFCILIYFRSKENNEESNNLVDEVFFSVWDRLREDNLFQKEDIKQLEVISLYVNSVAEIESSVFTVRKFRYLVDFDPSVLSVPLIPDDGNWLPIHFCADNEHMTLQDFIEVVRAGLLHNPEKLGHIFTTRTQRFELESDNNDDGDNGADEEVEHMIDVGTPFELACKVHGQPKVVEAVLKCFADFCCDSSLFARTTDDTGNNTTSSTNIMTQNTTASALLLSTVTDAAIHLDGLYLLLRKNPVDALLKLQQHLVPTQYRDLERSKQIQTTYNDTNVDITASKTLKVDIDDCNQKGDGNTLPTQPVSEDAEAGEKKRKYEAISSSAV